MLPRQNDTQLQFLARELEGLADPSHPLVKLGAQINWAAFDELLGATHTPGLGAPGANTRLMVALHYLKYQHDLSDEAVVEMWVENLYWQHFSGERYFQHHPPIDPSTMTRWRKRLGEKGAEQMLKETINTGLKMRVIKPSQLAHVNIDTTVQTKAIRHPTDGRLYQRAAERLVKQARKAGLRIKQSYSRVGKRLLQQVSRYAHARQMKRAAACVRKLKTQLGRLIREIQRQLDAEKPSPATPPELFELQTAPPKKTAFQPLGELLSVARRIHDQKRGDKNKVYSVHEPQVSCVAKGKAGKKYEFGDKVGLAVTSKGGWGLGALNHPGNPYDGHTLKPQLEQLRRLSPCAKRRVHVDMGYRKHGQDGGPEEVHVDRRHRGTIPKSLWKWMKRRAAVEPTIGHCKSGHRLERNRLKGVLGDAINALLSLAAMNFQKLRRAFLRLMLRLLFLLRPALPRPSLLSVI
jgi:IS5 family transposase